MNSIDGETPRQTALRNLLFVFAMTIGVIWIVKKLPFLKLRPQYKLRDENPELLK